MLLILSSALLLSSVSMGLADHDVTTASTVSCSKASFQGRMFPDPDDCRKFIRCVNRKPVTFTCPPMTAFDPDTQVCAWRVGRLGCGTKLPTASSPSSAWVGLFDSLINDVNAHKASVKASVQRGLKEKNVGRNNKQGKTTTPAKPNAGKFGSVEYGQIKNRNIGNKNKTKTGNMKNADGENLKPMQFEKVNAVDLGKQKAEKLQQIPAKVITDLGGKSKYKRYEQKMKKMAASGKPEQKPDIFASSGTYDVNGEPKTREDVKRDRKTKDDVKSETKLRGDEKEMPKWVDDGKKTTLTTDKRENITVNNVSKMSTKPDMVTPEPSELVDVTTTDTLTTTPTQPQADNTTAEITTVNTTLDPKVHPKAEISEFDVQFQPLKDTTNATASIVFTQTTKTPTEQNNSKTPSSIIKKNSGLLSSQLVKQFSSAPYSFDKFQPIPNPFKAKIAGRKPKYSRQNSTLEATATPSLNNPTTKSRPELYVKRSTASKRANFPVEGVTAMQKALKAITGRSVDRRSTVAYKPENPKQQKFLAMKKQADTTNSISSAAESKKLSNSKVNKTAPTTPSSVSINRTDNVSNAASDRSNMTSARASIANDSMPGKADDNSTLKVISHSASLPSNSSFENTTDVNVSTPQGKQNVSFMSAPYMVKGLSPPFRCPELNGHFVDPKDCSVYYHCANGVAYRRDCPPGQVFLPEAASCVSSTVAPPCLNTYIGATDVEENLASHVCEEPNGLYRDQTSCAHYFECTDGFSIRRKCMSGTVFDGARRRCTWSRFVPGCEGELKEEPERAHKVNFECLKDGYYRDPRDCSSYFLCAGGEALRMRCDEGTSFDVKRNMCVWSHLVEDCARQDVSEDLDEKNLVTSDNQNTMTSDNRNAMTSDDGNAMTSGERDSNSLKKNLESAQKGNSIDDFICPEENGVFPDLEDCTAYYTCTDEVAKRMRCPLGTGYDEATGLCMESRSVIRCTTSGGSEDGEAKTENTELVPFTCPENHGLFPDPHNCSRFVHCFNNTAYRHHCLPGTAFSAEKGLCTWRHLVPECQDHETIKLIPYKTQLNTKGKGAKSAPAQGRPLRKDQQIPYQTLTYAENTEPHTEPAVIQDFRCPSVMDGFFRDNLFCDIFHRCVLGTRFTFTCPTGTFFRLEGNLCDFWETVPDCTVDGIRTEAINSLPEVAPLPVPATPQPPPPPTEVDVEIVSIDTDPTPCPAASGLFAHPRNCKQFLFCAHNVPLVLTCPESLLYNSQTLTCDFAKNVQCLRYDHYKK